MFIKITMAKKKNSVKTIITNEDLKGYSLNDMLTKTYGPRGKASREEAETRINAIAQNMVMSNTLKELRERQHKSQREVADVMQVDGSVVSKLEKNFENAQIGTILRYAKALKVKNVDLVFEFKNKDKQVLHLDFK
jgi:DNA-binding XRE family transcriptional regulator